MDVIIFFNFGDNQYLNVSVVRVFVEGGFKKDY